MAYVKVQPREASGGKATIYWVAAFGAQPLEVVEWRVKVRAYAHFSVPVLEYREPKKRKWGQAPIELSRGGKGSVTLLVLDGWGHGGPKVKEDHADGRGWSTLYPTFDPRYASDFEDWANQYLALHASADHASVKVLADYRGWTGQEGAADVG